MKVVVETHMKLSITEPEFLGKNILIQKLAKNGPKAEFFEFIEEFGH